jgi:hypothetical protein
VEAIGNARLLSYLKDSRKAEIVSNQDVRNDHGHFVSSYLDLATKVAELQFLNRDHVLMFRGQGADFLNSKKNSSLKATLFRGAAAENPTESVLRRRFDILGRAEQILADSYAFEGKERVRRYRVVRWSILQHYEVCATPLLDVTQSLRIAASFASTTDSNEAFVFVLGIPNISGAITASAEAGIQVVRLASVCPPVAVRPHIQEGYLLGEYPELVGYSQKQMYGHYEVDFGRRLVAKFRFNPQKFWKSQEFPQVGRKALYPTSRTDAFAAAAKTIARQLD